MDEQPLTEDDIVMAIVKSLIIEVPEGFIPFSDIYNAATKLDPDINYDALYARINRAVKKGLYERMIIGGRAYFRKI